VIVFLCFATLERPSLIISTATVQALHLVTFSCA
jgi:hypothetical protein